MSQREVTWPVWRVAAGVVVAAVLLGAMASAIQASTRQARHAMDSRFETRVQLAEEFVETFVADVFERERVQAIHHMQGTVTDAEFAEAMGDLGVQAGVLLDEEGRALQVFPPRRDLVGADLALQYPHLASALAGRPTVSDVVPSASEGEPITAFAVPFDTGSGRRVLSGAFSLAESPLTAFLESSLPYEHSMRLTDSNGEVVVDEGRTDDGDGPHVATALPIDGTPWELSVRAPRRVVHQPIAGLNDVPWLMFGAMVAVGLITVWLYAIALRGRARHALLARTDQLTQVSNRRHVIEQLSDRRRQTTMDVASVLLVDVDHFKAINDEHGHDRGDDVLRSVAEVLVDTVRDGDTVGRWGGEEFVVVLPGTDLGAAAEVAERICATVRDRLGITVSVGCAAGALGEALVTAADQAVYAAKAAGRDRVALANA